MTRDGSGGQSAATPGGAVEFELFTSSFCGACARTRTVLQTATAFLPGGRIVEHDIAFEPELAEERGIAHTPTVIVRDAGGVEVFRAAGVPTVDQALTAAARALGLTAA